MRASPVTNRRRCLAVLGAAFGAAVGSLWLGCQGRHEAPKTPSEPKREPLRLRPISQLVVAASLSWAIFARPHEMLGNSALAPGFSRLLPPVRRAAFKKLTAIDLDSIKQVIVAGYGKSTLFVLDGVPDALEAERRFRDRLLQDVIRKTYRPDAIWTHGRTATGKLRAISALLPGVVAIEGGDSLRAKVALLFAIGRLHRSTRVLSMPDMKRLSDALGDAPIVALAPGPFGGDWNKALHGMLAACTAVGGSIRPDPEGRLDVSLRLVGVWGKDASRAARNLRAVWRDLERSSLGRLLWVDQPIEGPRVSDDAEVIGLDVRVDGVKLLGGLYDLVAAELNELLDLDPPKTR